MTQGWPQAQAHYSFAAPTFPASPSSKKPANAHSPVLLLQSYSVRVSINISASDPASESIQHPASSKAVPQTSSKAGIVHLCPIVITKRQPVLAFNCPKSRSTLHTPRQPACLPLPLWAATLPSPLPKCASLVRPVLQIVQYNPTFAVNFELDLHYCLEIQRPISSCRTHPNRRSLGSSIRRSVWVRVLRDHSNKATSTRRQALLSVAIYGIVPKSLHAVVRASRPKSPEQNRTK